MKQSFLGIVCAVGAAVFYSTFYVIAEYLFQIANQIALMALWFTWAGFFTLVIGFFLEKRGLFRQLAKHWKAGLAIAFTNVIVASAFFTSVNLIGPSATSFLGKLEIVFIVLFVFAFLKERLNLGEGVGIAIAFIGAFIFAFSTEDISSSVHIGVFAAMTAAIHTTLVRFYSQKVPIIIIKIWRTVMAAVVFTLLAVFHRELFRSRGSNSCPDRVRRSNYGSYRNGALLLLA